MEHKLGVFGSLSNSMHKIMEQLCGISVMLMLRLKCASWTCTAAHMRSTAPNGLWRVQSSGDIIGRYRATLVFYACVKSRAAFVEAFFLTSVDEIAGTLNAPLQAKHKYPKFSPHG